MQVWLQLTTQLGAERLSTKKFSKCSAQTFTNDKMTCMYRRINFSKVEIYIHLLINYSTRNLLQKLENCERKNGINFANEANQNISRSQTLAKTVKISAPK